MKKIFVSIVFAVITVASALAQGGMEPLPNDPAVKKGRLENGMTYYIRHNEKPAGRAEFYLATNVGAIQETPDQDGLAHFLEHMCFNGTKNFPGKDLLNWLQSIGASFGGNINASTGFEETQYMLNNIPLVRESVIDSCLLVMHDYSHFVTCDPVEIDKERGVIIEERRARRNANWRFLERSLPYYFGDSKYATCTLIGSQENLETFKPESLKNFYKTWYRPDMQALIVVGDVDVNAIEAKIKKIFADIPEAEVKKAKDVIKVPNHKEPIVGVLTDPEASSSSIELLWVSEAQPEEVNSTAFGTMTELLKYIISQVMYERFNDITSKADSPYLSGSLGVGNLIYENTDAVMANVTLKENDILGGFNSFLTEIEKLKRFGFTEGEITRAKDNILASYEKAANEAESRTNSEFVHPLINNFFDGYPYMEPKAEYELVKSILGQLNSTVLNQIVPQLFPEENLVVLYRGPKKEGIATPTESELLKSIADAKAAQIEAPKEESTNVALMDASKLKGSAVKKTSTTIYGAVEWTLKNGVKVIVLPTDYQKDQIIFNLSKNGGRSLIPTEDLASFEDNIYGMFRQNQGLSTFKSTELSKMLAGKNVGVNPFINGLYNGIAGNSSVKDLETAMQLLYLNFVEPRFDQEEFDNGIAQLKSLLPNVEKQPNFVFSKVAQEVMMNNSPRDPFITNELIEKANLQTIEKNYRKLFADAAGSTLVITGDVDIETLKPLVEKYVGSLPKGKKEPKWLDVEPAIVSGKVEKTFQQDMETPISTVMQVYTLNKDYTVKEDVMIDAISYILDQIYVDTLREDEGGTYGASTQGDSRKNPSGRYLMQVAFNSKPALTDKLRSLAIDGFKSLAENGPTDEQFTRTIEYFKKGIPESRINNSYWLNQIMNYVKTNTDVDKEREEAINGMTKESIQATAKELFESGNFVEVVMTPGKTTEAE